MTSSGPVITKQSADPALTEPALTEPALTQPALTNPALAGLYCLAI